MRPKPIGWLADVKKRMGLWNTISVVQSLTKAQANSVTTLQSSAFGSSPVTNNAIIVFIAIFKSPGGTTVSSVTDTQSNTYNKDKETGVVQSKLDSCIASAQGITGGATFKVTVNLAATGQITFGAVEVSGLATSSAVDQTNSNNGAATTTPTTGAITTTQANEIICISVCEGGVSITNTEATNFTRQVGETGATFVNMDGATQIVSAIQTGLNPQWTTGSATFGATIVSYKAPVGQVPYNPWYQLAPIFAQ